jgi:CRISPR-associated protein Cmr1
MPEVSLPPYGTLQPPKGVISWPIPLEVVTPLYGGGAHTRHVDAHTPVRASAIRGQLRFWWRALFGGAHTDAPTLYDRERALFGGLGKQHDQVVAARAQVHVGEVRPSAIDDSDIGFNDPAGYALWPARGTRRGDAPAERWAPGLRFTLQVRLSGAPAGSRDAHELECALRAWLLFGGIGGRIRRGCGALGIPEAAAREIWLPETLEPGTIAAWLSLAGPANRGFPSLSGSRLCLGRASKASDAWHEALRWLRDFRQGTHSSRTDTTAAGSFARQRPSLGGGNSGRPGRSRWPEPDLIRHLSGAGPHDHPTLIPATPSSWPRAQFGLPIQVRFQGKDRRGRPFANPPPGHCSLDWAPDGKTPRQRLASPLIVKPIQVRDGSFRPAALWLKRTLPDTALAGVLDERTQTLRGPAPIRNMPASPLFMPLAGKASVEDAFMDWLVHALRLTGGTL